MLSVPGLILSLLVTTLAVFERVAEVGSARFGFSAMLVLAILVLGWGVAVVGLARYRRRLTDGARSRSRLVIAMALLTWAVAMVAFAWVYPIVDSGRLGFESDREEAIDVGVRALARGEFPYACRAVSGIHDGCPQAGNPIGPWPGSFLLAAPAVAILGSAGWLSLLCLPLMAWALARYTGDPPAATVGVVACVLAAPIVPAEILTGGDLLANTVLVLCPLMLLVQDPRRRGAAALALLLGVALSWRGLLWMVVPAVLASFVARRQYATLLKTTALALVAFLIVTLPLVLWRPAEFTPWQVQQKLALFTDLLPHADRVFPLLGLIAGLALGWRARTPSAVLTAAAWAVLIPVLGAVLLNSIREGHPTFGFYGWYALAALPLFAVAVLTRGVYSRGQSKGTG